MNSKRPSGSTLSHLYSHAEIKGIEGWEKYGATWLTDDSGDIFLQYNLHCLTNVYTDHTGVLTAYKALALTNPPKRHPDWDKARTRGLGLPEYKREYERGWRFARRSGEISQAAFDRSPWAMGTSSAAYDDGYLDAHMDRPKWHMAFCPDHDHCGMD